MPGILREPEYPAGCLTRKTHNGVIRFEGVQYYLSDCFDGKCLELRKRGNGLVDILYGHYQVATINPFDRELFNKKISLWIP